MKSWTIMNSLIELISNTDDFLLQSIEANIVATYIILFLIIFLESGVILFPFLPGDGLLFSVGVVATITPLDIYIILPLLMISAIAGFIVNYKSGSVFGKWIIQKKYSSINIAYDNTRDFMSKHGKTAVVLSRFFPIIRTYLPFAAGIVHMKYDVFLKQTILGAVIWVSLFVCSGYFLGEVPWVKENYGLIFLGLIILTIIPLLVQMLKGLVKFISKKFNV